MVAAVAVEVVPSYGTARRTIHRLSDRHGDTEILTESLGKGASDGQAVREDDV